MKYLLLFSIFITSLFSIEEGAVLYASCKFCHGVKAQMIYVNKIPSIKDMDLETLELKLKLYKEGSIDAYGYGPIMKQQMKNISDEKISVLAKYIKNL